ncbi:GFA family protein [Ruegeria meonggei]|uniref:Glutathione-dependent formaldehyde-activating enzyme n=1 Tax=Ruegeria meonggei TaxID=1446476 RepID=A0A1X6Z6K9_9RHOB|nr:GFA family protein [Ruegeria meonggei]SLN42033.1 Glutathione-dependent formaldehyde-activating enzyme [Ruegeria meonggei]
MTELQGQCMCGAVTVTATPARDALGACHCDQCRRWTSSMLVTFQAEPGYAALGPVKVFTSSDWAERAFCAECGSALWYRITLPGEMHGHTQIAAGLFDNGAGHSLQLELFIDKKPDGYAFAGERRQMTTAEVEAMYALPEEGDSQ